MSRPRNRASLWRYSVQVLIAGANLVIACSCSKTPPPTSNFLADASATSDPVALCAADWAKGDRDVAVDKFLVVDWNNPALFAPGATLSYTENSLRMLSANDQERVLERISALKSMGAHLKQLADKAKSAKDSATAAKYLNALKGCGAALDQPQRLKIVQTIGRRFKKAASS